MNGATFDIRKFRQSKNKNTRFERRIQRLKDQGMDTKFVEQAVNNSIKNVNNGVDAFVIYGEPQSGKTEMMIALTAKLLDAGKKVIIILLNDNIPLLKQNLKRFRRAGIDPDPKNFTEILDKHVVIGNTEWIIFSKKNPKDLRKVIDKLSDVKGKTIIDDEADYASPNGKVRKEGEVTKINQLIGELLGEDGTYIGVTATPARLDLNNTFDNANDKWVNFSPHAHYTGQTVFFPINLDGEMKYKLNLLPDQGDVPEHLREALFSFFVTVAYLNTQINDAEDNYSMLIHTSGKRADHTQDYKQVISMLSILKDEDHKKYEKYVKRIWDMARERHGESVADTVTAYIVRNIPRSTPIVINSDADKKNVDYTDATEPNVPFSIAIGGNIVSRGVTFHNLLSMFFTRDVKHKIRQDTYIQRARMFGSRNKYKQYFELSIPSELFAGWHKCFVFHRLALESITSGRGCPIWLEDGRVNAVASGSIDKTTVTTDAGEMSYKHFNSTFESETIVNLAYQSKSGRLDSLYKLRTVLGDDQVPDYLLSYVKHFSPDGEESIAIHRSASIEGYRDADQKNIRRKRGFIGDWALEAEKFPKAIHHFKILRNADNIARLFYKYKAGKGSIKFLKNLKRMI